VQEQRLELNLELALGLALGGLLVERRQGCSEVELQGKLNRMQKRVTMRCTPEKWPIEIRLFLTLWRK
jgi:hypothetical protein